MIGKNFNQNELDTAEGKVRNALSVARSAVQFKEFMRVATVQKAWADLGIEGSINQSDALADFDLDTVFGTVRFAWSFLKIDQEVVGAWVAQYVIERCGQDPELIPVHTFVMDGSGDFSWFPGGDFKGSTCTERLGVSTQFRRMGRVIINAIFEILPNENPQA